MKRNLSKKSYNSIIIVFIFLFLVFSVAAFISINQKSIAHAYGNQEILVEGYDFSDNSVLVTMDKDVGGVNKIHDKSYFRDIAVTDITDLTHRENVTNVDLDRFNQILKLELQYHNKQYVLQAVDEISKIKGVESVSPNYFGEFCATANDSDYSQQWGLNGANGINIESAWEISTGSKDVRVGVIDTGIAQHSDLMDNLASGWNFVDNNSNTNDTAGHGTHVAGIIGAVGDNNNGISGVCKNVELVPLKISNVLKPWPTDNVIKAINYADDLWGTENQIDLLNFSGWNFSNDLNLYKAINAYRGLFVTISGNNGVDIDAKPNYPSNFKCANSIVVGAVKSDGERWTDSNYGKKTVDIFAPGSNIYSTLPNNSYGYMSGTSMAAPHVTGVAALLLSKDPTLTAAELKEIILSNADYITISTPDGSQKVRKLNAYNAFESNRDYYTVTLHSEGNLTEDKVIAVKYGEQLPEFFAPKKTGYAFDGYYDINGKKYYEMKVENDPQTAQINGLDEAKVEMAKPISGMIWDKHRNATLYGRWDTTPFECDSPYTAYHDSEHIGGGIAHLTHGASKISPVSIDGYNFNHFTYRGVNYSADEYIPVRLYRGLSGEIYLDGVLYAYYDKACLAEGSLITLADGSQVAVENLTGNETLLVWNLYTGTYDTAPILFIDSDPLQLYKVINLSFSDGTTVKVISEHGFWNYDLNKYVYLDENSEVYIGHWFNKGDTKVQLMGVEIKEEYTTPYSPVTYGHLCYFVDGMLSMPGGINGLFNIFDVDAETMRYDEVSMQLDIETYGLFTYEEFIEYLDVPEEVFEAFNGQYLKVAIGKGLIDMEKLASLVERYQEFF